LSADLDQRRVLQIDPHAGDVGKFWPQLFDYRIDVCAALGDRFQKNQEVASVLAALTSLAPTVDNTPTTLD